MNLNLFAETKAIVYLAMLLLVWLRLTPNAHVFDELVWKDLLDDRQKRKT